MRNFKILNSILHADLELYNKVSCISRSTWMKSKHKDIFSFFYQGGSDKTELIEDVLYLDCEDVFEHDKPGALPVGVLSYRKMLLMFEYCLQNFDFDFIFRTSSSTFVNYNLLSNFLKTKKPYKFYGGCVRRGIQKFPPYIHGHAILISRDLVELFVANVADHNSESMGHDDVILGDFLGRSSVPFYDMPELMESFNPNSKRNQPSLIAHRCKPPFRSPNRLYKNFTPLEFKKHLDWISKSFSLLNSNCR